MENTNFARKVPFMAFLHKSFIDDAMANHTLSLYIK